MTWNLNLRIFVLIRRLVIAAEGIHEQLKYSNDRTFPPVHLTNGGRKPTVFSRKKPADNL